MKTSEISQNRNVYLFESATGRENMEESTEKRKVLENIPGMKITISQEGLAACEEAAKNRQGNVGAMTGWEGIEAYERVTNTKEICFEHMKEFGEAMRQVEGKYKDDGDGVDSFMKTVLEAYEIMHRKIVERHKNGNREVTYEISGERSLTLEEDLEGLDELYDMWVNCIEGYISVRQRMKNWRPSNAVNRSGGDPDDKKNYTSEEYNEYRRSAIDIMKLGRRDYLELFKQMNGKEGIATGVLVDLMNRTPGFWTKTWELWSDKRKY